MEWNSKWEWENFVMFGSRACESPKKLLTDWGIEEVDMDAGSLNLSGGGVVSGGSGSDFGHGSSTRSTISASTDSSSKEGIRGSNVTFEAFEGFCGEIRKKNESGVSELTGPPLEASIGSGEHLIGLKLGKRTYFENNCGGSNGKTSSFTMIPSSSAVVAKKIKSNCQSVPAPHCQVEGCNLDLSSAKEYHRKHRVCESHSKSPKVVVAGLDRRFCQQCSRFHSLSEFDDKKRSCRRRLSDHNARRRKPPQETIQFKSARLHSPYYDGRQQMAFLLNNAPLVHKPGAASTWESPNSPKFTLTKGYLSKPEKAEEIDGQRHWPEIQLSRAISIPSHDTSRQLPSKGTTAEVVDQGLKESMLCFNQDAAPDLRRALSLLSTTSSWVSHEQQQQSVTLDHLLHLNPSFVPQHMVHAVSSGLPTVTPSEYWPASEQRSADSLAAANGNNSSIQVQGVHLFKPPYESGGFYSNQLT